MITCSLSRRSGEMADTLVLEASGETRGGSSPSCGRFTKNISVKSNTYNVCPHWFYLGVVGVMLLEDNPPFTERNRDGLSDQKRRQRFDLGGL